MSHHLTLCQTGRHGSWATCACGWRSGVFTTTTGAHLAFGEHLTTTPAEPTDEQGETDG